MFMLRQTSVKMAVLLHKQASDRFHLLLTVDTILNLLALLLHIGLGHKIIFKMMQFYIVSTA